MPQEHTFQISISEVGHTAQRVFQQETEQPPTFFSVRNAGSRPYESTGDRLHSAVAIEMNLDRKLIVSHNYTVLDWLSHLGGLLVAAFILLSLVFFIGSLNVFENFLVQQLFRGDFVLADVGFGNYNVNIAKYAAGKPLKGDRLSWWGEVKHAVFGSCPCPCA